MSHLSLQSSLNSEKLCETYLTFQTCAQSHLIGSNVHFTAKHAQYKRQ